MMRTVRHHLDPRRRGFSLAELVLALGVLAIGMTMAAALFPAAMKLNEQSARDSIGTIIAQNGLALINACVTQDDVDESGTLQCIADEEKTGPFTAKAMRYLADPNNDSSTQGFVVVGRMMDLNDPDIVAQFVVVSYKKQFLTSTVLAKKVTISNVAEESGVTTVRLDDIEEGKAVGSPLIFIDSEDLLCYPRITGWTDDEEAILDRKMENVSGTDAFVIAEENDGNVLTKSPAMTVLVVEKVLKPSGV